MRKQGKTKAQPVQFAVLCSAYALPLLLSFPPTSSDARWRSRRRKFFCCICSRISTGSFSDPVEKKVKRKETPSAARCISRCQSYRFPSFYHTLRLLVRHEAPLASTESHLFTRTAVRCRVATAHAVFLSKPKFPQYLICHVLELPRVASHALELDTM